MLLQLAPVQRGRLHGYHLGMELFRIPVLPFCILPYSFYFPIANRKKRLSQPTGMDWPLFEGLTCLPPTLGPTNATCTLGGMPSYVVNVTNVAQIQLAFNFARTLNLRLSVKGQGHDFNAKNVGAGSRYPGPWSRVCHRLIQGSCS